MKLVLVYILGECTCVCFMCLNILSHFHKNCFLQVKWKVVIWVIRVWQTWHICSINSEARCRNLKSVLCILLQLVYLPDTWKERALFLVLSYTSVVSIIFAEYVHNADLYLVVAGKFKGTFDLFIMNSQFMPIHVRWFKILYLLHWNSSWRKHWGVHRGDLSLNITPNLTQGGECITRYELHQKHNCKNGDYLRMQIGFSILFLHQTWYFF